VKIIEYISILNLRYSKSYALNKLIGNFNCIDYDVIRVNFNLK